METKKLQMPPKILMPDRTQNQFNDSLMQFLRVLAAHPLLQGTFLSVNGSTDISLVSGDNTLRHQLNHPVRGWFLVRSSAATTVYDKQATNDSPNETLILNSSSAAPVTATIYIF